MPNIELGVCVACAQGFLREALEGGVCRTCRMLPGVAMRMREELLANGATHASFGPTGKLSALPAPPSAETVRVLRAEYTAVVDLRPHDAAAAMVPHLLRGVIVAAQLARVGLIGPERTERTPAGMLLS